ncbi:unnamed protein product [Caretta caretta]
MGGGPDAWVPCRRWPAWAVVELALRPPRGRLGGGDWGETPGVSGWRDQDQNSAVAGHCDTWTQQGGSWGVWFSKERCLLDFGFGYSPAPPLAATETGIQGPARTQQRGPACEAGREQPWSEISRGPPRPRRGTSDTGGPLKVWLHGLATFLVTTYGMYLALWLVQKYLLQFACLYGFLQTLVLCVSIRAAEEEEESGGIPGGVDPGGGAEAERTE